MNIPTKIDYDDFIECDCVDCEYEVANGGKAELVHPEMKQQRREMAKMVYENVTGEEAPEDYLDEQERVILGPATRKALAKMYEPGNKVIGDAYMTIIRKDLGFDDGDNS